MTLYMIFFYNNILVIYYYHHHYYNTSKISLSLILPLCSSTINNMRARYHHYLTHTHHHHCVRVCVALLIASQVKKSLCQHTHTNERNKHQSTNITFIFVVIPSFFFT